MKKKVKVKTKSTVKPNNGKQPVKPKGGDSGLLSEKITTTVKKKKASKK